MAKDEIESQIEDAHHSQIDATHDWTGPEDCDDPHNWPLCKRSYASFVVGSVAFVCTFGSSIYAPAQINVVTDLSVATTVSLLPYSLYSLGLGAGSVLGSPWSEEFGRKSTYLASTPLFALFILGAGFSQNIVSLSICRFFAGVFASPGISIAAATITDVWPVESRAVPMACYWTMPWLGSVIGPFIGSFIVEFKGWRWTQWTVLFFLAVFGPIILLMPETYKSTILRHRAVHLDTSNDTGTRNRGPNEQESSRVARLETVLSNHITRPVHMLFTELIVGCVCLYTGFNYTLLYAFFASSNAWVFKTEYGFGLTDQGLSFLGFLPGVLAAPVFAVIFDKAVYKPKLRAAITSSSISSSSPLTSNHTSTTTQHLSPIPSPPQSQPRLPPPEARLYAAMIGAPFLPLSTFLFAFTAHRPISPFIAISACSLFTFGSFTVSVSLQTYIADTYSALYGASANSAMALARYGLTAALPLFLLDVYEKLGTKWATALLGFLQLPLLSVLGFFWVRGERLRGRSRYPYGD